MEAVILALRQHPQGGRAWQFIRIRILRIMRIYRIETMRCIVFTLCSRVKHWDRL